MDRALTTQEDEELQDLLRQGLTHLRPSELGTLLMRYARDPDFVAAFTRDTGHRVPEIILSSDAIQIVRREDWADKKTFYRYVLTHLKETGWAPPQDAAPPPGYDEDFYAWSQATAQAIRAGQWDEVDREALAEEVESLGKRDKRELDSRLEVLVMHLLKWCSQPVYREQSHSWADTILEQRRRLARLLDDSPSLRPTVRDALDDGYPVARQRASIQTDLPLATFPDACPWTPEQVLDEDFFPEA